MQLISKPFGGYKNVLEIDDVYFEDDYLPAYVKESLKISKREEQFNIKINTVANALGMKNTRWGRMTIIMFAFWAVLTSIACFLKPDFLNLTLSLMGLFIFLDPQ